VPVVQISKETPQMKSVVPTPSVATWPFTLPPLPFGEQALLPVISPQTLRLHYGKHHQGYADKLNALVRQRQMEHLSLVELIQHTHGNSEYTEIFNNAAQVWNHNFYWQSLMAPKAQGDVKARGALGQLIEECFGDLRALKGQIVHEAVTQFGSGWVWLVQEAGRLKVKKTGNAELPMAENCVPLLTVDVWEHAYYLDYQNRREEHVAAVVDNLLNWSFAAENLAQAEDLVRADVGR
jgi:superoxide dismutase, Fe-Mn family